jgi:hypothetical protein
MLFHLRIDREIVLLVFFAEVLRMRSTVPVSPLVFGRPPLTVTLLLKLVRFFNKRFPVKYF